MKYIILTKKQSQTDSLFVACPATLHLLKCLTLRVKGANPAIFGCINLFCILAILLKHYNGFLDFVCQETASEHSNP